MSIEVRPVRTRRELRTFIKLPWRIYRDEPKWIAPLLMDLKKRLDQDKNPFFKHAQVPIDAHRLPGPVQQLYVGALAHNVIPLVASVSNGHG